MRREALSVTGHGPHLEGPDAVAAAITGFLAPAAAFATKEER